MKRADGYKADDGTWFASAAEAKKHEETAEFRLLCGMKEADIIEAVERTNIVLANAFERIGSLIANKRRESGELRRAKEGVTAVLHPSTEGPLK